MRAIKVKAEIEADHSLRLELPSDVPKGPAEVIVLVDEPEARLPVETLSRLLPRLRAEGGKSRQDLDLALARERASWRD